MYPVIVCTCGQSLGELYSAFELMRYMKYKKYCNDNKIKIEPLYSFGSEIQLSLGDELDKLQIKMMCCRSAMMSQVLFRQYY